jgi:hypothetical protein
MAEKVMVLALRPVGGNRFEGTLSENPRYVDEHVLRLRAKGIPHDRPLIGGVSGTRAEIFRSLRKEMGASFGPHHYETKVLGALDEGRPSLPPGTKRG